MSARRTNDVGTSTGKPSRVLNTRRMSEVKAEPVNWLWAGRLPRGMFTLLEGDPDLGKSTIAIDLAARLTAGRPFPGSSRNVDPAGVVFLCSEDSAEHTLRPRLEAAGANLDLCHIIDTVTTGENARPPILPDDLPFIESFCTENRVGLLVIDPLFGFVNGAIDTHKDASARTLLHEIKRVAERTGAAVVGLRHLNKSNEGPAIYRGGGSIAITAQARVVLIVGRNPDNQDERLLAVTKCNIGMKPKALVYELSAVEVGQAKVSRVVWRGESDLSADDIVTRPKNRRVTAERREQAEAFLLAELAGGPVAAAELYERARKERITKGTLNNAKKSVGAKIKKQGMAGGWLWFLTPPTEGQDSPVQPEDARTDSMSESSGETLENAKIYPPSGSKSHSRDGSERADSNPAD